MTGEPDFGFTPPLGSCEDFQDATSFADSISVVHTIAFRDWSDTRCERRVFCSEPTSYRTFVHESGHSVFGLKDEYCCDSHYRQNDPNPNIWENRTNCVDDATAMGWNTGQLQQLLHGRKRQLRGRVLGHRSSALHYDRFRSCHRRARCASSNLHV